MIPSTTTFPANLSAGEMIAQLSDPFGDGGATLYAAVGTPPGPLALSGAAIVAGPGPATAGAPYAIKVRATSGNGRREVAETIDLTAQAALRPLTLAKTAAAADRQWSTTIVGATAGSTISVTADDGTPVTLTDRAVSARFEAPGTRSLALVETLDGALASPRTSTVSVAVGAVTMLPAAPMTDYAAVYSLHQLVADYAGPLATVCATSAPDTPSGTIDLHAGADGTPDLSAAVAAFGPTFDVCKLHDQTGQHPAAIQTLAARRMVVTATRFGGFVACHGGKNAGDLMLPTSLVTQRRDAAQLAVVAGPNCANDRMALFSLGDADVAGMFSTWTTQRGFKDRGDAEHDAYLAIDQNPCIAGFRLGASGNIYHRNEQTHQTGAYGAATMRGGSLGNLGDTTYVSAQSVGLARLADVIFAANPSDAEFAAVKAALKERFAIRTRDAQVLFCGSSIDCGLGQVVEGQPFPAANYEHFLAGGQLDRDPLLINLARGGWRTGDFVNSWGGEFLTVMKQPSIVRNVLYIGGDTNGIQGGLTLAQLIADFDTIRGWAQAADYTVVAGTVIQRGNFDASRNQLRADFNAGIKAKAADEGYRVVDFGDSVYDTTDGVHPTVAGYQAMAAMLKPVLDAALA